MDGRRDKNGNRQVADAHGFYPFSHDCEGLAPLLLFCHGKLKLSVLLSWQKVALLLYEFLMEKRPISSPLLTII